MKPALLTAASNLLLALPSHAEAGKIFGERIGARRWRQGTGQRCRSRPRSSAACAACPAPPNVPCPARAPADFNMTLPVMMGEFLLLMVFLDKVWFGPVGRVLDERDKELRGKLALVKDNGSEVGAACWVLALHQGSEGARAGAMQRSGAGCQAAACTGVGIGRAGPAGGGAGACRSARQARRQGGSFGAAGGGSAACGAVAARVARQRKDEQQLSGGSGS